MTQKEIFAIAANHEAMEIMREIEFIQQNLCYKTECEQKTQKAEMKALAKELLAMIAE